MREYLSRFNQAKRVCEKLSGYISNIYKPPIKINIQISTPWNSDEVPKARDKKYKNLAKEIANKISENIETLTSKNEYLKRLKLSGNTLIKINFMYNHNQHSNVQMYHQNNMIKYYVR